jgi:hypothetical protein
LLGLAPDATTSKATSSGQLRRLLLGLLLRLAPCPPTTQPTAPGLPPVATTTTTTTTAAAATASWQRCLLESWQRLRLLLWLATAPAT